MNRITGEASIEIAGKTYPLRFDWNALAHLDHAFPDGLDLTDPKVLAQVVAIGIPGGEVTAEMVLAESPPVMQTIDAVTRAHNLSYFGVEDAPKEDARPPQARPNDRGLRTLMSRLFGRASGRGSSGA